VPRHIGRATPQISPRWLQVSGRACEAIVGGNRARAGVPVASRRTSDGAAVASRYGATAMRPAAAIRPALPAASAVICRTTIAAAASPPEQQINEETAPRIANTLFSAQAVRLRRCLTDPLSAIAKPGDHPSWRILLGASFLAHPSWRRNPDCARGIHKSIAAGANSSSILTRRSVNPWACT